MAWLDGSRCCGCLRATAQGGGFRLNRRGLLALVFGAGWLVVGLAVISITVRYALPRRDPVVVGAMDEIPSDQPLYVVTEPDLALFLTRAGGDVIARDARSPVSQCRISWVPGERRYVDPCTGAQWCLDGGIADRRFQNATTLPHYRTEVTPDGQVLLYPWDRTPGEPLPADEIVHDPMAIGEARVDCAVP